MFVLQDDLETKKRNKPVYFQEMTEFGPMYTDDFDKAKKFSTKQDATNCPAFANPLCSFKPRKI
jgi:hypothetical protein